MGDYYFNGLWLVRDVFFLLVKNHVLFKFQAACSALRTFNILVENVFSCQFCQCQDAIVESEVKMILSQKSQSQN